MHIEYGLEIKIIYMYLLNLAWKYLCFVKHMITLLRQTKLFSVQ